jgi:hypothetical protein
MSMKFKKEALRKIIQEELQAVLNEQLTPDELKSIGMTADEFDSLPNDEKAAYTKMAKGETETITDKPTMIKGRRRDPLLIKVQQELNRLGAFDNNGKPIKVDGIPGPKTATALAAVLPGFQCIGRKSKASGCEHSAKFLKQPGLLRASLAALSKKSPFSSDEMTNMVAQALKNKKDVVNVTATQIAQQILQPVKDIKKEPPSAVAKALAEPPPPTASPTPKGDDDDDDVKTVNESVKNKFQRFL